MVFVSYSWDSDGHIKKVGQLVKLLKKSGIRTVWDQDLELGKRIPSFMEEGLQKCGRVLFICTPRYKEKADGRDGGVGYETNVITGDLYRSHNDMKYIPVLFDGGWTDSLPVWASGKLGADLRNDNMREFEKLLDALRDPADTAGAEARGVPALLPSPGAEAPFPDAEERRVMGRIYEGLLDIKRWLVQLQWRSTGLKDPSGSWVRMWDAGRDLRRMKATYDFILKEDVLEALRTFFGQWDDFQYFCICSASTERAVKPVRKDAGKKKERSPRLPDPDSGDDVGTQLWRSHADVRKACNEALFAVAKRLS